MACPALPRTVRKEHGKGQDVRQEGESYNIRTPKFKKLKTYEKHKYINYYIIYLSNMNFKKEI